MKHMDMQLMGTDILGDFNQVQWKKSEIKQKQ